MQYIDIDTPVGQVEAYLEKIGWLKNETVTRLEKPGEGNMNVVIRVFTDRRTFILKQSRPYVRKYPAIAAPPERIDTEYRFYQAVTTDEPDSPFPKVLNYKRDEYLMMMEDLGACRDMTGLYADRNIDEETLKRLVTAAQRIHRSRPKSAFPLNSELRKLNHQHIFVLPFMEENGFELDRIQPGLQEVSMAYRGSQRLRGVVAGLGRKYLSEGSELIHGDYYPGSWVDASSKLYVIDAEFGFWGFREFDLGVMCAHLILSTSDSSYIDSACHLYGAPVNRTLVEQIAGIEMMRRLIGLAQLPLTRSLEEKQRLLALAHDLILRQA